MKTCIALIVVGLFVVAAFAADDDKKRPPFLEGADDKVVKEFEDLLAKSSGLTDAKIDEAVDGWVSKQSAGIKTKYAAFKGDLKKHQDASEMAHKAAVAKFSADAKSADEKLSAVANNPGLSAKAKGEEIEKIISGLPKAVREEIEKAMSG